MRTIDEIMESVTTEYLETIDIASVPTFDEIRNSLLKLVADEVELENAVRKKEMKLNYPQMLPAVVIGKILLKLFYIRVLNWADDDMSESEPSRIENSTLVIYQSNGTNKGLYVDDESIIRNYVRKLNIYADAKMFKEVISYLEDNAPCVRKTQDRDLVAVNNGIFDYRKKVLMPFSPDYVFTSKSYVNYNPTATNVVIHNEKDGTDWDVESWMADISDDPDVTKLLWEILGAVIRPNVNWDKMVLFYSEVGSNGKGTLCQLMKNLCGKNGYASISIPEFSKEFFLAQLLHVNAVIADENPVGIIVRDGSGIKVVITQDTLVINRKHKDPLTFRFRGLVVQCLNDFIKFLDKSESLYRRLLIVPFVKTFTGRERKYIKYDYLARQEVLEYVLYKVLNTDYYEFSNPEACESLLDVYKAANDPVRQFVDEIFPQLQWDFIPTGFLYDLYKVWAAKNIGGGKDVYHLGRNKFIEQVKSLMAVQYGYQFIKQQPPYHMMDAAEPLIAEYNLTDWMNPAYKGNDVDQLCHPLLKTSYSGLKKM